MTENFGEKLNLKIGAGIPIIQIISSEWKRVINYAAQAARENQRILYIWNNTDGFLKWDIQQKKFSQDEVVKNIQKNEENFNPDHILKWYIRDAPDHSIILMEDLHLYFNSDKFAEISGCLRTLSRKNEISAKSSKTIILSQPIRDLPSGLEKDVYVMEIPLPNRRLLLKVINKTIKELNLSKENAPPEERELLVEAALGLTLNEAKFTFKEIAIENEKLTKEEIPFVLNEKEQIIEKSGILEYHQPIGNFPSIGGMENLMSWLQFRKAGFHPDARDFGIKPPKGILLLGVQGCGKSSITKAIAGEWNIPLLHLDLGEVFSNAIGESQRNIKKAHNIARAIAPSILWIDGVEKGFTGLASIDKQESGIKARACGSMVEWMLEKKEPVFIVATANDIERLPHDMLRKGRFDELFFVDLPGDEARKDIWKIHLKRRLAGRFNGKDFHFHRLSSASVGYTGAEIEDAINEALYLAFNERRDVTQKDLIQTLATIYPTSKIMTRKILKLRDWAKVRTRLASNEDPVRISSEKRIIPILKQEANNPFIN